MPLHLVKMAVGVATVEEIETIQARRIVRANCGGRAMVPSLTRFRPRRADELIDGGSLYWVVKGAIQARQRILDIAPVVGDDGMAKCELRLDPLLVRTEARPLRAFQGWRYLEPATAPPDLKTNEPDDGPPPEMANELRRLGLL